ncbi:hypothetical protein [Roseateles terrae]|uniref:DUF58 domain-containing protein n=1 Tax=Roseateles terrae TaxID=431060 RepID=A0ABR6GSP6_9BURK|nr:hypothetical protein [Roseateles terrae]MBB3195143.1 hypothetical protein [Roseateles terrae]OWQ87165.1 hypothetical protein CDN98_09960 [Roseateles terrae]
MTRRFVCPPDPVWRLLQDLLRLAGLMAALLAVLLQLASPYWTVMGSAAGVMAAALGMTHRHRHLLRTPANATDAATARDARADADADADVVTLRWDTQSWWLQRAGAPLANGKTADAGSRAPAQAVHLQVLLDVEHWMLLRLVPLGSERRFWRHRCLAVSRRQQGGHWSLLRIHLFMARS